MAKGPRMAQSVEDRLRGARMARRDEGAYCRYVTEEQRRQPGKPGWIGREIDRLSHSRALSSALSSGGRSAAPSAGTEWSAASLVEQNEASSNFSNARRGFTAWLSYESGQ